MVDIIDHRGHPGYHGTPLCDTACRRCGQAGHLTKLCIGPIQAAVAALKRQKETAKHIQQGQMSAAAGQMSANGQMSDHGHFGGNSGEDVGNLNDLLDQLEMEN